MALPARLSSSTLNFQGLRAGGGNASRPYFLGSIFDPDRIEEMHRRQDGTGLVCDVDVVVKHHAVLIFGRLGESGSSAA